MCGRKILVPLELQWGLQETSRVASGKSSLLSSCKGERVIALESLQGNQASSHNERGNSGCFLRCNWKFGFLSSCDGDLREPLMLPQVSQASFQFARGTSRYLSSHCRGIGPHLELRHVTQSSSPVAAGILGFLSSFNRGVRPRLMLRQETFAFLLSCKSGIMPPVEFGWGTWAFSRGEPVESDLLSCCEGILVVPFELVQENQASSRFEGQFGVLLSGTAGFLSRFNR